MEGLSARSSFGSSADILTNWHIDLNHIAKRSWIHTVTIPTKIDPGSGARKVWNSKCLLLVFVLSLVELWKWDDDHYLSIRLVLRSLCLLLANQALWIIHVRMNSYAACLQFWYLHYLSSRILVWLKWKNSHVNDFCQWQRGHNLATLLDQVQDRDQALRDWAEELNARVDKRTADLRW